MEKPKPILTSKLIEMLQESVAKYGDLPVYKTIEEPIHEESNISAIIGYTTIHSNDGSEKGKPEYLIVADSEDADMFGPSDDAEGGE